jgi:hypothetical protein
MCFPLKEHVLYPWTYICVKDARAAVGEVTARCACPSWVVQQLGLSYASPFPDRARSFPSQLLALDFYFLRSPEVKTEPGQSFFLETWTAARVSWDEPAPE